jgi:hypothetical protein
VFLEKNPILTKIQDELAEIGETKTVKFVWAPGHAGIDGNEKADKGAKKDNAYLHNRWWWQPIWSPEQNSTQKKLSNKLGNNTTAPTFLYFLSFLEPSVWILIFLLYFCSSIFAVSAWNVMLLVPFRIA